MDRAEPTHDANDYMNISKADIVHQCRNPIRVCLYKNGKSEIVALPNLAIKHGKISAEEVRNQLHASYWLDPAIVRVPRIYSQFSIDGMDYVVMERVCGEKKQSIQDQDTVDRIARIVNHLHAFTSSTPGPVSGGICSGPLWSEDECVTLPTKQSLEDYVRSKLKRRSEKFVIADTPLVFTHGDIAPRNLLFAANQIWLLDWEFAGYFPRSAEIAAFRLGVGSRESDQAFHRDLEAAVLRENPLNSIEAEQVSCWQELAVNHVRFYWPSDEEKCYMRKRRRRMDGVAVPL